MCVGRGLDSPVPSTSTLNTTHLLNHLTAASGAAVQLLSGATRQGARRGGPGSKRPGHLPPYPPYPLSWTPVRETTPSPRPPGRRSRVDLTTPPPPPSLPPAPWTSGREPLLPPLLPLPHPAPAPVPLSSSPPERGSPLPPPSPLPLSPTSLPERGGPPQTTSR